MELILKIEVCISSKRIRQKERTSTGIISSATNLHTLKLLVCKKGDKLIKLGLSQFLWQACSSLKLKPWMKLVLNVKVNHDPERIRLKYQTFLRG